MSQLGTEANNPQTEAGAAAPAGPDGATTVAPVAAAETPPATGAAAEGGGENEVDSGSPPPQLQAPALQADPEPKPAAKSKDWRDDRIRVLTAKLDEARRASTADQTKTPDAVPASEIERRAAELAAANDFNRRCNEVVEQGKATWPDFMNRVEQLRSLVTPGDAAEAQAFNSFIAAVLETGEAGRVLYELGGNPEEALRVMALSPVRLGMELAKMTSKKAAPEPSQAPRPIRPVGTQAKETEIDPADATRADNLSTRTWIERRQREVDARRKAGERIW